MKPTAAILFFLFPAFSLCANDTLVLRETIYFQSGKAELDSVEQLKLKAFADKLFFHGNIFVEIEGHTDDIGSKEANAILGKNRAMRVDSFLRSLELNFKSQISYVEPQAAGSSTSSIDKKQLRKAEIKAVVPKISSISDFWDAYRLQKTQKFKINPNLRQSVITNGGMKFSFPEQSFVDKKGNLVAKGMVEIEVVEALQFSDMFLMGLSTVTSDGNILQTGGMFKINAKFNGEELSLSEGKSIDFFVPTAKAIQGMSVYQESKPTPEKTTDSIANSRGPIVWNRTGISRVYTYVPKYIHLDNTIKAKFSKLNGTARPSNKPILIVPRNPVLLRPPHKPQLVAKEDFRFKPKHLLQHLYSPKKKAKIEENRYQTALLVYHKKLKKYKTDSIKFEQTGKSYNYQEILRFENERLAFEKKLQEHFQSIVDHQILKVSPEFVKKCNERVVFCSSADSVRDSKYTFMDLYKYLNPTQISTITLKSLSAYFSSTKPNIKGYIQKNYGTSNFEDVKLSMYNTSKPTKGNSDYTLINRYLLTRTCLDTITENPVFNTRFEFEGNFEREAPSRFYLTRTRKERPRFYEYPFSYAMLNEEETMALEKKASKGKITWEDGMNYMGSFGFFSTWYNLDAPFGVNTPLTSITVLESNETYMVLLSKSNQFVLPMPSINPKAYAAYVPTKSEKSDTHIISLKIVDGQPFVSDLEVNYAWKKPIEMPTYKSCKLEEVKKMIDMTQY